MTTTSVFIPLLYCEQSTKYKPEFKLLPDLTQCTTESVFSIKSEAGIISALPHRQQNRVRSFSKSQVWYIKYLHCLTIGRTEPVFSVKIKRVVSSLPCLTVFSVKVKGTIISREENLEGESIFFSKSCLLH